MIILGFGSVELFIFPSPFETHNHLLWLLASLCAALLKNAQESLMNNELVKYQFVIERINRPKAGRISKWAWYLKYTERNCFAQAVEKDWAWFVRVLNHFLTMNYQLQKKSCGIIYPISYLNIANRCIQWEVLPKSLE